MLRLHVQRAMVSFVDLTNQYFISGALDNELEPNPDACTWFGCNNVKVAGNPCEQTVAATQKSEKHPTFIVNDLLADDRYKDQPYVNGTLASYRFYAGVPITTGRNINIGTLFVFGDDPRPEGLTDFQHQCEKSFIIHLF